LRKLGKLTGQIRRHLFQLPQRLADDLELPLDRRAQHPVAEILVERPPADEVGDRVRALSLASQR
jgi:hypothetical protein